jgi:membrane-associated phospholipid phosphatase/tRNA A-37 threonylcarbamoyl transferase component Bud32
MAGENSAESFDRNPSDVIRLVLGLLIFLGCAMLARRTVPIVLETDAFRLFNNLPEAASLPLQGIMQLGSFAAIIVLAIAALVARRRRLALDLLLSGVLAWLLAKWLKSVIQRERPVVVIGDVIIRGSEAASLGFPSGHAAVASALAAAAGPYVSHGTGRILWLIVWFVAIARVYVGAHLPIDVIGGIALGWAVGAAVHLALGSPSKSPTPKAVQQALQQAGVNATRVYRPSVDARGSAPFFAETEDGTDLFVKVVGQEQRYADWLFKMTRSLVYRELEDERPFMSPKQQIEREAYMSLLAERAEVRTPPITLAIEIEDGAGLLAQERISAKGLDSLHADELDDEVLRKLWGQVALLRHRHIAHRDLRQANMLVDGHGEPWLIDFGFGEAGASQRRLNQDIAEMMASLACLVGAERPVRTALEILGEDAVLGAAPLLQPMALSTATRTDLKAHPGLLEEMRQQVAGQTGKTPPPLERLTRLPTRPRA